MQNNVESWLLVHPKSSRRARRVRQEERDKLESVIREGRDKIRAAFVEASNHAKVTVVSKDKEAAD